MTNFNYCLIKNIIILLLLLIIAKTNSIRREEIEPMLLGSVPDTLLFAISLNNSFS